MRCQVAVPMILDLHGNAITHSAAIGIDKVGRGKLLVEFPTHYWKNDRPFTLAVTHRHSSHFTLLGNRLRRHGGASAEHVEIILLPPFLMLRCLKTGTSMAVARASGKGRAPFKSLLARETGGIPNTRFGTDRGVPTLPESRFPRRSHRHSCTPASWVLSELRNAGTIPEGTFGALPRIFRGDLYHAPRLSTAGV